MSRVLVFVKKMSLTDRIFWGLAVLGFLFLTYSFCYTLDTISILHYEWSFAASLVKGDFLKFYEFPFQMMQFWNPQHSPTYDLPMNLVLGIWGLPMYFYSQHVGFTDVYISFACRLWGKSIYVVALVLLLIIIFRICKSLGQTRERALITAFISLTSIMLLSGSAVAGQTDIIGLVMALWGFKAYIDNKHWLFVLMFMFAFPFKQYSFFVFLPLLVLKEKRILRIGLDCIIVVLFTQIANIPIKATPAAYDFKREFSQYMFSGLIKQKLPFSDYVSTFLVVWGILIVYCYLTNFLDLSEEKRKDYIVFVSAAAIMSVFVGFDANGYWYVNTVPYMAILITHFATNENHIFLFETVGMSSAMINNYIKNYWVYDVTNMNNMLLDRVTGSKGYQGASTMGDIVKTSGLDQYGVVFDSVYFVCMIAIFGLVFPNLRHQGNLLETGIVKRYAYMRGILNFVIVCIPVVLFLVGLR